MTNNLKRQVEVQGMKKLDNVKGVQTLNANELKQIEGGGFWSWIKKHLGIGTVTIPDSENQTSHTYPVIEATFKF